MAKKPFRKLEILSDEDRNRKISEGAKRRGIFRFNRALQTKDSKPFVAAPLAIDVSPPTRNKTPIPIPSEASQKQVYSNLRKQYAEASQARTRRNLGMGILKVVAGLIGIFFFISVLGVIRRGREVAFPSMIVIAMAVAILRRRLFR